MRKTGLVEGLKSGGVAKMLLSGGCVVGAFRSLESAAAFPLSPFCRHVLTDTKKPPREKWLNLMILKLKFGGPYWT